MKMKLLAVVAMAMCTTVGAQQAPLRQPGLWEIVLRSSVGTVIRPVTVSQCSTADQEPAVLLSIMPGQEVCKPAQIKKTKDGYTIVTVCKVHDAGQTSTMDIKTVSAHRYTGKFAVKYDDPKLNQSQGIKLDVFDATWIGPCPDGWKAGDMRLSNGVKVNVLDDKARAIEAAKKDADHDHEHGHGAAAHKH